MNQAFHVIQHLIGLGFILVHEREAKAKGDQAIDPELFFAFLSLLIFFSREYLVSVFTHTLLDINRHQVKKKSV